MKSLKKTMVLLAFALFVVLCGRLDGCMSADSNPVLVGLDQLNDAIKNGPNRKVGFLSGGNFQSVAGFLDDHVEPEFFGDSLELENAVRTGDVIAGK